MQEQYLLLAACVSFRTKGAPATVLRIKSPIASGWGSEKTYSKISASAGTSIKLATSARSTSFVLCSGSRICRNVRESPAENVLASTKTSVAMELVVWKRLVKASVSTTFLTLYIINHVPSGQAQPQLPG
jgi:hypothetical protein